MKEKLISSLRKLKEIRRKPFIVSLSGPSSCGKSTLIQMLLDRFGSDIAESFGSSSRKLIKTESDRYSKKVQRKMLRDAVKRDFQALNSNKLIVFLDRNPIDGLVYQTAYFGRNSIHTRIFEQLAKDIVRKYDLVFLIERREDVFVFDDKRTEFDRKFSKEFFEKYQKLFPYREKLIVLRQSDLTTQLEKILIQISEKVLSLKRENPFQFLRQRNRKSLLSSKCF